MNPWIFVACQLFLICGAVAQSASDGVTRRAVYEGMIIRQVRFEPPNQPLARSEIQRLIPLREGETFQMATVRSTIERLYATGLYQDIAVDAKEVPGGVGLSIVTRDRWFVGPVEVRGNLDSPPNAGQLANATGQPDSSWARLSKTMTSKAPPEASEICWSATACTIPPFRWTCRAITNSGKLRSFTGSTPAAAPG
jgi:hypothetical protein